MSAAMLFTVVPVATVDANTKFYGTKGGNTTWAAHQLNFGLKVRSARMVKSSHMFVKGSAVYVRNIEFQMTGYVCDLDQFATRYAPDLQWVLVEE